MKEGRALEYRCECGGRGRLSRLRYTKDEVTVRGGRQE